jgi:hypothetical protein
MLRRRSLLRSARLVLGAFLLAQAALALSACDWGARDAARALSAAAGSGEAPCHDSGNAVPEPDLCLPHCLGEQQSLDKPSLAVPAIVAVAMPWIAPTARTQAERVIRRERPLAAAAPPPRILFQSFLI